MKRILALIAVVGLLSFGILASTVSAASTSVVNRDIFRGSAMVAKDQTNDGSYYAFAQTVKLTEPSMVMSTVWLKTFSSTEPSMVMLSVLDSA